jgi:glutamine synthetase adenylyltransferase
MAWNSAAAPALDRRGDDEALLNLLRRAHHAEVFRTLARDIEGVLSVEQVADDLSALAQAVLRTTTQWCWERLRNRHRDPTSCHHCLWKTGRQTRLRQRSGHRLCLRRR